MALTELIPWKKTNKELALRREAASPFDQFRKEMDQLFANFLSDWPGRIAPMDQHLGSFVPDVDIKETEKEVHVTAELPGLDEKQVEVTLTAGALTIKGEKREQHEEKKETCIARSAATACSSVPYSSLPAWMQIGRARRLKNACSG